MANKARFQQIKNNAKGEAYVSYNGRRYYLSEFMRVESQEYHGYKTISNSYSLVIFISECGEAAKVWEIY